MISASPAPCVVRLPTRATRLAADGEGALSIARTKPPDVVILDLMLPGIDGLEVCRRLRASGDAVAVLMLTARDTVADRVKEDES